MAAVIGTVVVSLIARYGGSDFEVGTMELPLQASPGGPLLNVTAKTERQMRRGMKRAFRRAARSL